MVGAGPWARIAPGGGPRGRPPPKARARRPLDGPGAHRVGDFRGLSCPRSEAAPIVDARRWPIRAPSCPGVQADDHRIQAARAGAVPLGYPPRPRASLPGTVGATGLEGPHLRGRRSLPHSRFLVLGRADGADPALPTIPDDRSVQRPARVPGPLFERSGQQATGPSDHRPARIDPLEQAVQRPTGTQPLHHTRARQHEPSHHQSSRIDPFKSKGYTDN